MEALFERAEEVELCSSANGRSHSSAVPSVMMVGHLDELSLSGSLVPPLSPVLPASVCL